MLNRTQSDQNLTIPQTQPIQASKPVTATLPVATVVSIASATPAPEETFWDVWGKEKLPASQLSPILVAIRRQEVIDNAKKYKDALNHMRILQSRMQQQLIKVCAPIDHPICNDIQNVISRGTQLTLHNRNKSHERLPQTFSPITDNAIITEEDSEEYCLQSFLLRGLPIEIAKVLKFRLHAESYLCGSHLLQNDSDRLSKLWGEWGIEGTTQKDRFVWWLNRMKDMIPETNKESPVAYIQRTLRRMLMAQNAANETESYSNACKEITDALFLNIIPQAQPKQSRISSLREISPLYISMVCEPTRMKYADQLNQAKDYLKVFTILQMVNRLSSLQVKNTADILVDYSWPNSQQITGIRQYVGDKRLDDLNPNDVKALSFMTSRDVGISAAMDLLSFFGADYILQQNNLTLSRYQANMDVLLDCFEQSSFYIRYEMETFSSVMGHPDKNRRLAPMSECLSPSDLNSYNFLFNLNARSIQGEKVIDPTLLIPVISVSIMIIILLLYVMNKRYSFIKPATNYVKNSIFGASAPAAKLANPKNLKYMPKVRQLNGVHSTSALHLNAQRPLRVTHSVPLRAIKLGK
jgi:hypothetical protein